jgi:CxxC motif-containing protein (DUF1111 family)
MTLYPCLKTSHLRLLAICLSAAIIMSTGKLLAQTDPGPRPGAAGAGGNFSGLNAQELTRFVDGLGDFQEVDSVSGTVAGENGTGLGPTFNGNSCAQCHAQPAVGGTGPSPASPQVPQPNPQVALATLDGAQNTVPSFVTANGPVREARFVRNANGTPDGGVHGIYTIRSRVDAQGCNITQENFAQQVAANNVIFRIPTPVFGLGLVENTADSILQANLATTASQRAAAGITGAFNFNGNDGTIARFGWKAQNKSLLLFSGEAYNVEQGVSNRIFQNERKDVNGCIVNPTPEDQEDIFAFADFMRFSAPPTPAPFSSSATNGSNNFVNIGCALCHSPRLTTGNVSITGMSNVTYAPYSDFAIHHMGTGLQDGVTQGGAGPDMFRSAPLWGLGQRLFFLHDGRTSNLLTAIQAHSSSGSEANTVINRFNALTTQQKQDILNFLRSL